MNQRNRTMPVQDTVNTAPLSHSMSAPASGTDNTSPVSSPSDHQPDSSPTSSPRQVFHRSTTVELEENPAYHPLGGPDYLKVLAKYNLFGKDEVQGRVVCRFVDTGNPRKRKPEVIKIDEFSAEGTQEFLAHVAIGNPPQILRVDLDTGSSDFWVFSSLLKPSQRAKAAEKHTIFNHAHSKTWRWPRLERGGLSRLFSFHRQELQWDIRYGDGSTASGVVGFDNVKLGETEITDQAVQLANDFSGNQFRDGSADGILGLAFGHLNSVQPEAVQTPLEKMVEQNLLPEHVFTVSLRSECFFTFGFIDEETRAGRDIHWVDIDSRGGFWNFSSKYARVGNKRLRRASGAAIADTGSSIILTHPHIVWLIYKNVEGAKYDRNQPGWVYPIGARVPEVAFSVGDDDSCMILINEENMRHSELGNGWVFGAIQENTAYESGGLQFDIFGTPFFRQVYAIFDIKGERFGVIKESPDPMISCAISESPVVMEGFVDAYQDEIEDSIDGSILEEHPRRGSTMMSLIELPILESSLEHEVVPEEDSETVQEAGSATEAIKSLEINV